MSNNPSAVKRTRQNERRRLRNVPKRSKMKTAIKKIRTAADKTIASTELQKTISILDKLANKGIIHKNKAANIKSRLTKSVKKMN